MQHTIQLEAVATARLRGNTWSATGPQNTNTTVSGINAGETAVNRAFIRFGDFEIPSYANIVSATLQVYVSARSSSSGYTHYIYPITDNGNLWTPQSRNGATWSTAARSTIYLARDGVWVSAGLANIAEAWKSGAADPERGVCIFSEAAGSWKQFDGAGRANKPRLVIVYDVPASVPVPDKSSVALGGSLTTSLIVNETGASHVIAYKIGSVTLASYNIGTATSHTYTIPTSAGANFPNALTAPLTVEVTTAVNGETRGSVTHEVTLTLPSDAAPTASCALTRTWASGVSSAAKISAYVQRKSGATFALTGTGKYGASVASFRLTFDGRTYTREGNGSIAHAQIAGSGAMSYTYTVTDSRGLSREYTGSLNVLAWTEPKIARFSIARVRSDGTEAVDGTYALASVQATISSLKVSGAEKNRISYYIRYREAGTEAWTSGDAATVTGTSVNASALIRRQNANVGSFNDMSGYEFQLVLSDIYAASEAADEMPTKDVRLCLDQNTGSIGFGGEAQSVGGGPEYDFYGPVRLRAGVTGTVVYSTKESDTGNLWLDGRPIYSKMILFSAPTNANASTAVTFDFSSIDTAWVDPSSTFFIARDSTTTISHPGYMADTGARLFMAQLRPDRDQLLVITNIAGTAYIRVCYTKTADDPTYYYLPFLHSSNEQNCVITSSSIFSNLYTREYAFNGLTANYWACLNNDANRWIQVRMPYALRNMTVTLVSPQGSAVRTSNIPVSGSFQGSNNGSTWTALGSYAGRSTAAGSTTTHSLNNSTGYRYLRVKVTSPGSSSGTWTGFGDIRVQGEVAS